MGIWSKIGGGLKRFGIASYSRSKQTAKYLAKKGYSGSKTAGRLAWNKAKYEWNTNEWKRKAYINRYLIDHGWKEKPGKWSGWAIRNGGRVNVKTGEFKPFASVSRPATVTVKKIPDYKGYRLVFHKGKYHRVKW